MFYVSFMVTTEQKPAVNTQKIKRKESKHTTAENQEITKNRTRVEERNRNYKTARKQLLITKW